MTVGKITSSRTYKIKRWEQQITAPNKNEEGHNLLITEN